MKMKLSERLVFCLTLSVLLIRSCHGYGSRRPKGKGPTFDPADSDVHTCSVTKGNKLTSFVYGKSEVQVPCRYFLAEFTCHMKTQIIVESSFDDDGSTYISYVSVNKSRGMQSPEGVVQDFDQASISMADFKNFLEAGKLDKSHWTHTGEALFWKGKNKWRLQGNYDPDVGQTVLTDGSGQIHVYLSYLDAEIDPAKKGNLTVQCTSVSFAAVYKSPGYLCGNVGNNLEKADTRQHLKNAAAALKLSTRDYITYNILVEHDVPQTNPICKEASDLTRDCEDSVEAVKVCGPLLDRKLYAKCFMKNDIDPLQAYVNCLKSSCDKDMPACNALKGALGVCPGKLVQKLPCA